MRRVGEGVRRGGVTGVGTTACATLVTLRPGFMWFFWQAAARCHRLGQTKTVRVFRLVTTSSVEEKILERTKQKLIQDEIVQRVGLSTRTARPPQMDLESLLKFSAESVFQQQGARGGAGVSGAVEEDPGDVQLLKLNIEEVGRAS